MQGGSPLEGIPGGGMDQQGGINLSRVRRISEPSVRRASGYEYCLLLDIGAQIGVLET